MSVDKAHRLVNPWNPSFLERFRFLFVVLPDQFVLPTDGPIPVNLRLSHIDSEIAHFVGQMKELGGPDQGFLGNTSSIESRPSQSLMFGDRHLGSQIRCRFGGADSRHPSANHQHVEIHSPIPPSIQRKYPMGYFSWTTSAPQLDS